MPSNRNRAFDFFSYIILKSCLVGISTRLVLSKQKFEKLQLKELPTQMSFDSVSGAA